MTMNMKLSRRRFLTTGTVTTLGISTSVFAQSNKIDVQTLFTPSGWMGDGEYGRKYINFSGADRSGPHSPPSSIKITYTFGPKKFGGIYWQNEPDNWGDQPGKNYLGRGLSKLTFWARGQSGEEVVEFKSGGINPRGKRYRDSFSETLGRATLTRDWNQHQIDLSHADLSSVIGAFCWVASPDYNSGSSVTFFLDDIFLE